MVGAIWGYQGFCDITFCLWKCCLVRGKARFYITSCHPLMDKVQTTIFRFVSRLLDNVDISFKKFYSNSSTPFFRSLVFFFSGGYSVYLASLIVTSNILIFIDFLCFIFQVICSLCHTEQDVSCLLKNLWGYIYHQSL